VNKNLAGDKIEDAIQSTRSLRAMLRTRYVAEVGGQVLEFLSGVEQILPLLDSLPGAADTVQKLRDSLRQLTASSRDQDNVRCMDDLQYEILPVLKKLQRSFQK